MRRQLPFEMILVALVTCALCLVRTWPLALEMDGALPRHPRLESEHSARSFGDAFNLSHARQVVAGEAAPFATEALFAPRGHSLTWHEHALLWGVLAAPLTQLWGPVLAANLLRFLLPGLAAAAAWALARRVGANAPGACLVVLAWVFSPPMAHGLLGSLGEAPAPFAPLTLLCLLAWMDAGSKPGSARQRAALGTGAVIGLALLSGPTRLATSLAMLTLTLVIAPPLKGERRRTGRGGLLDSRAWIMALLALLCLGLPWLSAASESPAPDAPGWRAASPSAAALLRPPELHPLFPQQSAPDLPEPAPAAHFLGTALLSLALWAALLEPRSRRWLLMALCLFLIAIDPGGLLGGLAERGGGWRALFGPLPARALGLAFLPLAVGAALGVGRLTSGRDGRVGLVAAALLFVFELQVRSPQALARVEVPAQVSMISALEGSGGVVVLPLSLRPHPSQIWQGVHRRPSPAAHLSVIEAARVQSLRATYPELVQSAFDGWQPDPQGLALDLRAAHIDHVLMREQDTSRPARVEAALDQMEGWTRGPSAGSVHWWFRTARAWTEPTLARLVGIPEPSRGGS